jgi:thiamine biosynthesis lipoprotein
VPVVVSADTFALVERAVQASALTQGAFNPLVGLALESLGYDRDFARLGADAGPRAAPNYRPETAAALRLDRYLPSVTVPISSAFDPGGIGKGLAADVVVDELMVAGARGAMVNLGGDLAIAGTPPDEHGWIVGIEDPAHPGTHLARVTVVAGGVCTSSRVQRTWTGSDGSTVHHLVDPQTGRPVVSPIVTVTVVAGAAWWAEALTKVVFVAGVDAMREHLDGAHVLVVHADGAIEMLGNPGVFDTESDRSGSA